MMTHPGYIDDYTKSITSYLEREKEMCILKEVKQKGMFAGIKLIN